MKFDKKYISGQFTLVIILALLFCVGIIFFMVKTMTVDKKKWETVKKENCNTYALHNVLLKPSRHRRIADFPGFFQRFLFSPAVFIII